MTTQPENAESAPWPPVPAHGAARKAALAQESITASGQAAPDLALLDVPRTSSYLNNKIRNVCLILSVLVVLNHARTLYFEYDWEGLKLASAEAVVVVAGPLESLVQHFLSGALGRITNPVFFAVSGFLFFYAWRADLASWRKKLQKRFFTLLMPYFIWSALGKAQGLVYYVIVNWEAVFPQGSRRGFTLGDLAAVYWNLSPPTQLWFLHDLMLIMVLWVPLLAFLASRLRLYMLPLILALYFVTMPKPIVDKAGLCYFSFGAVLGYVRSDLSFPAGGWRWGAIGVWLGVAMAYTLLSLYTEWRLQPLFRLMVLSGVVGMWALYDLLPQRAHHALGGLSSWRFFIYMGFDPLLPILQETWLRLVPSSQATRIASYFLLTAVVVSILVGVATKLRRHWPRFYYFITGGR
ncbi:MAG: acyltransferase [Verrucomicrobia bacterium]|nr:acyltransferase [Verrucomicrobiota bacterium]